MPESTVKLPIEVEDKKALAELKNIQRALGAVGKESTALNAAIARSMESMAQKTKFAMDDIVEKTKKAKMGWTEFNQALEIGSKVIKGVQKAVELAKFADEFKRLERAIPVEKMRELERQAGGTASKFELMQKAAKDMGISATEGMDATGKALHRVLGEWENFFDRAKVAVGSMIIDTLLLLDKLSDKLAGVERLSAGKQLAKSTSEMAMAEFDRQGKGERLRAIVGRMEHGGRMSLEEKALYDEFMVLQASGIRDYGGKYSSQAAADKVARPDGRYGYDRAPGNIHGRGGGLGEQAKELVEKRKQAAARAAAEAKKYPHDSFFSGFDSSNPLAYQNMNWKGYLGTAANESYQEMGGSDPLAYLQSSFGGSSGLSKGFGNMFSGLQSAGQAAGGGVNQVLNAQLADFDEMKVTAEEATAAINAGFGALGNGISAAVEAAVSGSDSIGRAFAKATQMALRSLAIENTVRALTEGALAIAAAARYDGVGATKHAAAAAKHAIAAAAAGAGSAVMGALGGGGSAAPPGGGGGGSSGRPATGSQLGSNGPQVINVYVQGAISSGDYSKLGAEIEKAVDTGRRSGRVRDQQTVTTRFE
jgi:hypothetical protein